MNIDGQIMYIIGEPGAGKSTLAAHLTRRIPHIDSNVPFAHRRYGAVVELGKRRPDFPGTDALSMSVQPIVKDWLAHVQPMLVFGEGDRLGNLKFIEEAEELGYRVLLYCFTGQEAAELHRSIRGSNQDPKWIEGRRSKVMNLANRRPGTRWLRAGAPLKELEDKIAEDTDNRVAAALREMRQ